MFHRPGLPDRVLDEDRLAVTTTNGERFTTEEHRQLAALMFKRFGRDEAAFCAAWRRMMQNNAPDAVLLRDLNIKSP